MIDRRAVRRDDVTVDPTHGLELPGIRCRRDRTASPAEAEMLIEALPESQRALWAMAICVGPRRGELQERSWSDLDLKKGIGRVERALLGTVRSRSVSYPGMRAWRCTCDHANGMMTPHPAVVDAAPMTDTSARPPELPAEAWIDRLVSLLAPVSRVVQPKLYGVEHLPADGSLLVGNHTIYGLLDVPFMMAEIWKERRIAIRGLGEHAHYAVPVWRDLLTVGGMVRGTRENVRALMRRRQTILVFPGGAREVNKTRGQRYQLLWRERIGFARLAIEFGYPIVPFAAVGAEEMLDVIIDQATPIYGELARGYEKLMGFPTPPMVRGIGLTPIPRPERLYFWFGEPIETGRFGGRGDDTVAARALRDEVKNDILLGIQFLRDERDQDPKRDLLTRLRRRAD
jgi:1-acyl-sn-glycerol-3-phosphate acyltransferase